MLRYVPKVENGEISLQDWWLRRAKRLLPMVAISAVAYELILISHLNVYGTQWLNISVTIWGTVITSLGMQEGWVWENPYVNNPVWYISVLMACYIIFFILTALASRLKCKPLYFYILMVLLGCGITTYEINRPFLNTQIARGYYSFFFGLFLAMFIKANGVKWKTQLCAVICLLFFTVVFIYYPEYGAQGLNYTLTFIVVPSLILLFETKWLKRVFNSRLWRILSSISFEVYLWHNPMLPLMYVVLGVLGIQTDFSSPNSMLLFLMMSWIVGTVMYYFVEVPISKKLQNNNLLANTK